MDFDIVICLTLFKVQNNSCNYTVPFNVSGLCNLGPDHLSRKPRDKIAWVSVTLHDWLKVLLT